MASPYACADHCGGPFATAYRQLKAAVLSAAVDAESLPPNAATGIIVRIGKCSAYNVRNTCVIAGTTEAAITSVPMCGFESKPQYVMRQVAQLGWTDRAGRRSGMPALAELRRGDGGGVARRTHPGRRLLGSSERARERGGRSPLVAEAVGRPDGVGPPRGRGLAVGLGLGVGLGVVLALGVRLELTAGSWLEAAAAAAPRTRLGSTLRRRVCDCSYKRWRVGR